MDADVVVVGGGVLGAMSAWQLGREGLTVMLVDPMDPGTQASAGSLAWLNVSSTADMNYARLRRASLDRWHALKNSYTDCPIKFQGCLIWGDDPDLVEPHARRMAEVGWPVDAVDADQITPQVPALAHPPAAAIYAPSEGAAHPDRIASWALSMSQAAGVRTSRGRAEQFLVSDGKVSGVVLEDGRSVSAKHVIVAGGIGSRALLQSLDLTIALRESPGILMRTSPQAPVIPHVFATPKLDFWQDDDGVILMSSSLAKTNARADGMAEASAIEVLTTMFPRLQGVTVERSVRRDRPIPEDGFPMVGRIGPEGLWLAVTHSGMTLAPAIAQTLADGLMGRPQSIDMLAYVPDRDMSEHTEVGAL